MVGPTTKLVLALLVVTLTLAQPETAKNPAEPQQQTSRIAKNPIEPQLEDQATTNLVNQSSDDHHHREATATTTTGHHLPATTPESSTGFDQTSNTSSFWSTINEAINNRLNDHEAGTDFNLAAAIPITNVINSVSSIGETVKGALGIFRKLSTAVDGVKDKFDHPIRTMFEMWRTMGMNIPEGVTEPCASHVRLAYHEFLSTLIEWRNPLFEWSVHMFDAIAKPVPGIMRGAINFPGSYSQCLSIAVANNGTMIAPTYRPGDPDVAFVGEHCVVNIELPKSIIPKPFQKLLEANKNLVDRYWPEVSLRYAFCFPSSCNLEDKNKLMMALSAKIYLEARVDQKMCHTKIPRPMDKVAIWLSVLVIIPVVLVLAASIYDFWKFRCGNSMSELESSRSGSRSAVAAFFGKAFMGFSAFRSMKKLLDVPAHSESTHSFILGIRALSMAWVVYGHAYLSIAIPDVPGRELLNVLDMIKNWWIAPPLYGALYSVDTFFFLSGFCSIYFFLQMKATHKFTIVDFLNMYHKRYTRLTPAMIYVIIFVAGPWRYIWSGPYWSPVDDQSDNCRRVWWSDILYIGNFRGMVEDRNLFCQPQFWYLMVDTQMYLLVPPFLFIIIRRPRWGFASLVALFVTALSIRGFKNYQDNNTFIYKIAISELSKHLDFDPIAAMHAYIYPWMRGHTYVLGMILGLMLHRIQESGVHLKKHVVRFGWILCVSITSATCSINYYFNNGYIDPTYGWNYFIGLTSTAVWSLAIGWIVFACLHGYGGFARQFLSCQMFVVLGRLSYGIYLVHLLVGTSGISSIQTAVALDAFVMITFAVTMMVFSIVVATALYILVEAPVSNIKFGVVYEKKRTAAPGTDYTLLRNAVNSLNGINKGDNEEMMTLIDTDENPLKPNA